MPWYKCIGYRGHVGSGKSNEVAFYAFADDAWDVLERYLRIMPGVKSSSYRYPDIFPIKDEKEVRSLEEKITEEGRISLEKAMQTWYYPNIEGCPKWLDSQLEPD